MNRSTRYAVEILVVALVATIALLRWGVTDEPGTAKPASPKPLPPKPAPAPDPATVAAAEYQAKVNKVVNEANQPIVFYGRAVDEDGAVLEGVKVTARIAKYVVLKGEPVQKDESVVVTSGPDGRFTVENQAGFLLLITGLQKQGYQCVGRLGESFRYGLGGEDHHPDGNRPVDYRMFRERGIPQIKKMSHTLRFKWEGTPVRYDMETGIPGDSGDLLLVPRRKNYDPKNPANYDWSLDISVEGGGLIYCGKNPELFAPKEGYQPGISVGRGYNDRTLVSPLHHFYVITRTRAGKHYLLHFLLDTTNWEEDAKSTGMLIVTWNKDGSELLGKPYVPETRGEVEK